MGAWDAQTDHDAMAGTPAQASLSSSARAEASLDAADQSYDLPTRSQETEDDAGEDCDLSLGASKKGTREPKRCNQPRLWCHILLHKRHPDFDLVPMLIGRGGKNMKDIFSRTNAKIRVRGRGSGHLEVDRKKEAPVPLMVAVTSNKADAKAFTLAIRMTIDRLKEVAENFESWCSLRQIPNPGALFSIGELSTGAELLLQEEMPEVMLPRNDASRRGGPTPMLSTSPSQPLPWTSALLSQGSFNVENLNPLSYNPYGDYSSSSYPTIDTSALEWSPWVSPPPALPPPMMPAEVAAGLCGQLGQQRDLADESELPHLYESEVSAFLKMTEDS